MKKRVVVVIMEYYEGGIWGRASSTSYSNYYYNNNMHGGMGMGISSSSSSSSGSSSGGAEGMVVRLAAESAVVVFSRSSCCMCHAVKRLLCGMGVNPRVYDLDLHPRGHDIETSLITMLNLLSETNNANSTTTTLPVVFVGGNLLGAMDAVLASHINGSLVPLLKQAGALWL